jgi:hypothetical protein
MKVQELMSELKKYDPNALVVTACYEFGFATIEKVSEVPIVSTTQRYDNQATYIHADKDGNGAEPIQAVCLGALEPSLVDV